MKFNYDKYEVRLLDKSNLKELEEVQSLRYEHLLRDFNPSLETGGLDADGYDKYADSIIVIDLEKNIIVGTYRVATKKTVGNHDFYVEGEFNIDSIKNKDCEIVELGRAVVHTDYRSGLVFQILWAGIYQYILDNDCKYVFGTCSLHGIKPEIYPNLLAYFKHELAFSEPIYAKVNAFNFDYVDNYDMAKVKEEMPSLVRLYVMMGIKISSNGYIDYDFNSCDVLSIGEKDSMNMRFFERINKFRK